MSGIWVWLEQFQGQVPSVSWEALGVARRLAEAMAGPVTAVLLGHGVAARAEEAIAMGADMVRVAEHPDLADFRLEPYLAVLAPMVAEAQPQAVLLGGTARGRELVGGLAAELGTAALMDVIEVSVEDGRIMAVRPIYEGKLFARVTVERGPALLAIRGRAFPKPEPDPSRRGEVIAVPVDLEASGFPTEVLEWIPEAAGEIPLNEARILFGGLAVFEKPGWLRDVLTVLQNDPDPALRDAYGWYFDILPVHSYSYAWQTFRYLNQAAATLRDFRLNKELWVNESGLPVWDDYPGPTWDPDSGYRGTREEQAAYVVQSAAYALWLGARVVFHFMLHDDCGNGPEARDAFGLYRNPSPAPCYPSDAGARPAAAAYRLVAAHLQGATPLWRWRSTGGATDWGACTGRVEWFAFRRPDGARVLLAWTRMNEPAVITVTAAAPSGVVYDVRSGAATLVAPAGGVYTFTLPPATNYNTPTWCNPGREKRGEAAVGGLPLFLVEPGP